MIDSADDPHAWDRSERIYPPFDKIEPYPKFLVINIYSGYTLTQGRLICITDHAQMPIAQQLQAALAKFGFEWEIRKHLPLEGTKLVGIQFEIKPLVYGSGGYRLEINIGPGDDWGRPDIYGGIISLVAHDLVGLERTVHTLIQIIELNYVGNMYEDIAAMWVRDWLDD